MLVSEGAAMTEAGWLTCKYPVALLWWLRGHGSTRNFRLFACAAGRAEEVRGAVFASDAYFDSWERAIDSENVDDWIEDTPLVMRWDSPPDMSLRVLGQGVGFRPDLAELVRDIFGNPFRPVTFSPSWRTDTAVSLARQMYESREFSAMPILADALQDAGCDNDDILNHCRDAKQVHVRGCWVVDLVLGKA
jgi:hypothetical protein